VSVLPAATIPLDNVALYMRNYMSSMNEMTVTLPFDIYYQYFNPSANIRTIRIDLVNNVSDVTSDLLGNQGVKVIDLRSIVIWGLRYNDLYRALREFDMFVIMPLNNYCNLIYSNGIYDRVYFA
jgi:hypothetical protein